MKIRPKRLWHICSRRSGDGVRLRPQLRLSRLGTSYVKVWRGRARTTKISSVSVLKRHLGRYGEYDFIIHREILGGSPCILIKSAWWWRMQPGVNKGISVLRRRHGVGSRDSELIAPLPSPWRRVSPLPAARHDANSFRRPTFDRLNATTSIQHGRPTPRFAEEASLPDELLHSETRQCPDFRRSKSSGPRLQRAVEKAAAPGRHRQWQQ